MNPYWLESFGLLAPLLVAVATCTSSYPSACNERFGLLALAWGMIGYAGALDSGIGRALTQMVGRLRGEGNVPAIPDALATAGRITLVAGRGRSNNRTCRRSRSRCLD